MENVHFCGKVTMKANNQVIIYLLSFIVLFVLGDGKLMKIAENWFKIWIEREGNMLEKFPLFIETICRKQISRHKIFQALIYDIYFASLLLVNWMENLRKTFIDKCFSTANFFARFSSHTPHQTVLWRLRITQNLLKDLYSFDWKHFILLF